MIFTGELDSVFTLIIIIAIFAFVMATLISRRLIGKKFSKSKHLRGSILFLAVGALLVFIELLFLGDLLNMLSGLLFSCLYFTSKIYFGDKGISMPAFPFYLKKESIIFYRIKNAKLIIGRTEGKEIKMMIDEKDIGNIEAQMRKLKIRKQ